ncbi:nuclear transport factor 2 family protein [Rhizobium tubonense]|nr:nuclear transport factor 2 family protein [Rhizobium tubonense]
MPGFSNEIKMQCTPEEVMMVRLCARSVKSLVKIFTLLLGFGIMLGGTAIAASCVDKMNPAWLPPRANIVNPAPADRQAIMDLIHSYSWALDEKNTAAFAELFISDAQYEACSGGGALQLVKTTSTSDLQGYISDILSDLGARQARHFESNTLLHQNKDGSVNGKTTLLVTLQWPDREVPEPDYTAVMQETFVKDKEGLWRFSKLTLITDTPGVQARAR